MLGLHVESLSERGLMEVAALSLHKILDTKTHPTTDSTQTGTVNRARMIMHRCSLLAAPTLATNANQSKGYRGVVVGSCLSVQPTLRNAGRRA